MFDWVQAVKASLFCEIMQQMSYCYLLNKKDKCVIVLLIHADTIIPSFYSFIATVITCFRRPDIACMLVRLGQQ